MLCNIRVGEIDTPDLIARKIASNSRVLCAAPRYLAQFGEPTTLSELASHRCLPVRECDQAFGRWKLSGPDGTQVVRVAGPMSSNNGEVVHAWAIDGHGIILRSMWDVKPSLESGQLMRVLVDYAQPADVWALYQNGLSTLVKMRVFAQSGYPALQAGAAKLREQPASSNVAQAPSRSEEVRGGLMSGLANYFTSSSAQGAGTGSIFKSVLDNVIKGSRSSDDDAVNKLKTRSSVTVASQRAHAADNANRGHISGLIKRPATVQANKEVLI